VDKTRGRFVRLTGTLAQGCHLAFLKLLARNKMIWPFFGLFQMLTKIVYFKDCFGQIWANFKHFHFSGFGLFWNCLWPNLAFLIFWTWQPCFGSFTSDFGFHGFNYYNHYFISSFCTNKFKPIFLMHCIEEWFSTEVPWHTRCHEDDLGVPPSIGFFVICWVFLWNLSIISLRVVVSQCKGAEKSFY